ncbi:MAG: hypothetical protein R2844_12720 [Caldilineales bacterium]
MREFTTTRRVGYGIVLGVLTGIVVVALTYIVDKVTGVGFPPFSLFDFMTRVLPGAVVTATIDLMVGVISRLNVGSTASAAKLAEQSFAILQFIVLGGVMGAVLGLFRNIRRLPTYGLGIGLVLVAAFAAIQAYLGFPAVGATASIGWIVLVFGFWGMALGWTLRGMLAVPADEAAAGGLSRRQAIYLGGTALAAVAAALVGLGFLLRGSQQAQQASATPIPAGGPTASPTETALAGRIEPAPGTRPEITSNDDFYRIDINTRPPSIAEDDWTLEIGGLVDNPSTLTLADIRPPDPVAVRHPLVHLQPHWRRPHQHRAVDRHPLQGSAGRLWPATGRQSNRHRGRGWLLRDGRHGRHDGRTDTAGVRDERAAAAAGARVPAAHLHPQPLRDEAAQVDRAHDGSGRRA